MKRGDTLGRIAAAHGTTVDALVEINGIKNKNLILPGQVIYMTPVAAACGKLAKLGVINSPDYWTEVAEEGTVQYLDTLLTKAAQAITKAGTRTKTREEGLASLVAAGVINTPKYWENKMETVAILVVVTNIIVQVVKKATWDKIPTNLLVIIVSMVLTVSTALAIFQIKAVAVTWYMIAAVLVLGIFVAYAAMFGFDKFREALEQINKYKD